MRLAALAVAVLAVSCLAAVVRGWTPISDEALIELRVRDVGGRDTPLVGVYSRFGWNHPGPIHFYVLAPFYRLGGQKSEALLVAALTMQFLCVVATWRVASLSKRVQWTLLVAAMTTMVGIGATALRSPWNPYVGVGGTIVLIAAAWSFSSGHRLGALWMAPIAVALVQTHLVLAPMVVFVSTAAVIGCVALRHGWPSWSAPAIGAGLGLALWIPPIVQQLLFSPGNISAIVTTGAGDEARVGLAASARLMSQNFAMVPASLLSETVEGFGPPDRWAIPMWGVVCGGAALRLKGSGLGRLWAVSAAAVAGSVWATAMITGPPNGYLQLAGRGASLVLIATSIAVLCVAAPIPRPVRGRVVAAFAVVLVGILGVQQLAGHNPSQTHAPGVDQITRAVIASLEESDTVAVNEGLALTSAEYARAVMLDLERRGVQVASPSMGATKVGRVRATRPFDIEIVFAPVDHVAVLQAQGWDHLLSYQPLSIGELDRLEVLEGQRHVAIDRAHHDASAALEVISLSDEITELHNGRYPIAVMRR